jgi:putative ABC transport system permease protein
MLRNYFTTAFRHLAKSKVYTLISVLGLAVGMSSCFLMVQYVNFEMSFDRFHSESERIYRVAYVQYENGELKKSSAGTFFGIGPMLRDNFPEVEHVVRFYNWPANTGATLLVDGKVFNERKYMFSEPGFFQVFSSLLIRGNPETCLTNPNSIVISRRLALKMYGTEDVLGKVMTRLDLKDWPLTVTGLMQDVPENSHLDLDVIIPFDEDWKPQKENMWKYPSNWTYLIVKEGTNGEALEAKLNKLVQKEHHDNPDVMGASMVLQPLVDIHFHSDLKDEIKPNGNKNVIYGVGAAALIILLIAWINYINLETSKFLTRMREVGVRRIVGSTRWQLVAQFFVQYLGVSVLAFLLAGLIVYLLLPYYPLITGVPIVAFSMGAPIPWMAAGIFFIVGAILTGIYPALFVVKFNPVLSLKGKVGNIHVAGLKKTLLTFQFVTSIVLLAFLFIVYQQLAFMRSAERNLEVDKVLTVYNTTSYTIFEDSLRKEKSLNFRTKLLAYENFKSVTASSVVPGEPVGFTYHNLTKRSLTDPDDGVAYKVIFVDYYFVPVFGLNLKAGRNYDPESGEDNNHNSIVLNESAIHSLGFKSADEALNQEIYFMVTWDWKKYKIIGIVEDYRHESVKTPLHPTIFFLHKYVGQMTYYSMLMDRQSNVEESLARAEQTWKSIWPEKPFDYFFMDQHYDAQYKSEIYFGRIFGVFAGVAIFLACLGVSGVTLFEVNARLKEISIRKVLGATLGSLVALLTRPNLRLVALSMLLAIPIIYYLSAEWLSTYPIKMKFSISSLLIPLVTMLTLVGVVAGLQTLKAALGNPIENLKHE